MILPLLSVARFVRMWIMGLVVGWNNSPNALRGKQTPSGDPRRKKIFERGCKIESDGLRFGFWG